MNTSELSKEEIWKIIEATNAVVRGHCKLSGELHSDVKILCGEILRHSSTYAQEICEALYKKISDIQNVDCIMSPSEVGGIILAHELAKRFGVSCFFAHRSPGQRYPLLEPTQIPSGTNVLIVDDGINSGTTIHQLLGLVSENHAQCVGIAVLLDRYYPGNLSQDTFGVRVEALMKLEITVYNTNKNECPRCQEEKELLEKRDKTKSKLEHQRIEQELAKLKLISY